MKKTLITIVLLLNLTIAFSQSLDKKYQPIVSMFINQVKSNQQDKLSARIRFPLNRAYPIPPIKNKQEFIKRYPEIFDDELFAKIVNSNIAKDWSAVGWRGIMLLNGDLWLDYDGSLIAINYQSKSEQNEQARLIAQEKTKLHATIKKFSQPVMAIETKKFRIRIDDMGNNNYRYTSWPINSKQSDKPSLVITKGKYIPDGSGGNHHYQFNNGDYSYTCFVWILRESETPPAQLVISKGDKEILVQDAVTLK